MISVHFPRAARIGCVLLAAAAFGAAAPAAEPERVVHAVPFLPNAPAVTMEIYLPARALSDPPAPTLVWVGDAQSGDGGSAQALADRGYACAVVSARSNDPRACALEVKNAIRFLRRHAADYEVDPDRFAVGGNGAGAGVALLVGLSTPDPRLEPAAPYPEVPDAVSACVAVDGDPGAPAWSESLAHVRSDSPPVFLGDADPGGRLDQTLTDDGVAHRVAAPVAGSQGFDWDRSGAIAFLRQYLGIAAHGLPVMPEAPSPRVTIDLDPGWRFFPHDSDRGADPGLDDSSWQEVNLPHTWNAIDGENGPTYRRGASWYRRHLLVDSSLAGKRLYLQFDGACFQADVYVNGKHLGTHLGGFARFRFDATDSLKVGQDNLIAVRVDNSALGIIPVRADFTFFGGLYRPVSLVATSPVELSMTDYGSSGVFVTQNRVTRERADLNIRAEVENYEDKDRKVDIIMDVLDAEGRKVGSTGIRLTISAGDAFTASQNISIAQPHLWDGEADPYLYSVRVTVRSNGKLSDALAVPLGLRFYRVDPNQGFFLNGHYLDLHGVNRHQDRINEGWAISQADEAEDFALIRELGCTALRMSHYQHSETWYQRCDRAGIVVWAEIPFVDDALPTDVFLENAKDQLRELIRQNYNHPSICFWSVGNETRGQAADNVISELADLAKTEDSTRLSTYASNAKPEDPRNWHTDVVGFNHYAGWYPDAGSVDSVGKFLDDVHAAHPGRAFAMSEYGAGASIFEHALPPRQPLAGGLFHPEEYQTFFHEKYWAALSARPFVWGKFVWCMFDFASASRHEGDHPGRNDKGLVTYDRRTRKDAFYFYKANWSAEPVVYIASGRFLVRHRPDTDIAVFSNAPEVELVLNGRSLGTARGAEHVFRWPGTVLKPGDNTVCAIGHFGPLELADGCTWTYRPMPKQSNAPSAAR